MNKGILAIATFITALIAWFFVLSCPRILSIKNKQILIRIAALPIVILTAFLIDFIEDKYRFPSWISADTIHFIIIATIISLFGMELGFLLLPRRRTFFPFCSNVLNSVHDF